MSSQLVKISLLTSVAALATVPASAQQVNYREMQDMFGESVTISANGKPQRASDVSATMDIFNAEDIRKSGASTIPQFLRRVAGMDFMTMAANQDEIGIRGYNSGYSNRVLVLINGRQVYNNFFGNVPWKHLPVVLGEIRQIEVVRGPNAALFGFNAVSGVINIVTKNPLQEEGGYVSGHRGTRGLVEGEAALNAQISDRMAIRLSGGYTDTHHFEGIAKTVFNATPGGSNEVTKGNLEIVYQASERMVVGFEANLAQGNMDNISNLNGATPARGDGFKAFRGYIQRDTDFGLIKVNAYRNSFEYGDVGTATSGRYAEDLTVINSEALIRLNPTNTLRFAAEYRHDNADVDIHIRGLPVVDDTAATLTTQIYSFSGMWNSQLSEKLDLTAALRYDVQKHSRSGFEVPGYESISGNDLFGELEYKELSINVAALYHLSEGKSLRASFARAAQTPNALDQNLLLYTSLIPGFVAIPNPTIQPTVVYNGEIGYQQNIDSLNGKFRVTAFYQTNSDMKNPLQNSFRLLNGALPYLQSRNVGDSDAMGFEVELSGMTEIGIQWGLNYSYVDVSDDLDNRDVNGNLIIATEFENQSAKHHANLFANYETEKFLVSAALHYTSGRIQASSAGLAQAYNEVEIGGHLFADLHLSYKLLEDLSVYVSGENLFAGDDSYSSIFTTMKPRFMTGVKFTF